MRPFEGGGGRRSRGITLPELLVVVSIIALAVAIAIPVISEAVRSAKVRSAADQFTVSIMAARMIAVTRQAPVSITVAVDPGNYFEYPDRSGEMRRYEMPSGVRIVSSTNPITFRMNGGVDGGATTRIEADMGGSTVEIWEIDTSIMGVARVTHWRTP